MSQETSATAAADPDRLVIQSFLHGDPARPKIQTIHLGDDADPTSATFAIHEEGHTLGNALRHIIMKNSDVDFCAYTIPHPSEAKLHLRIQTSRGTAAEALERGLNDLVAVADVCLSKLEHSEQRHLAEGA